MPWDKFFGQTRRTFLKTAVAAGVLSNTSTVRAQEVLFEFGATTQGWQARQPTRLRGAVNPPLDVWGTHEIVWENEDGEPHGLVIEDDAGNIINQTDVVADQGATRSVTVSADITANPPLPARYYCPEHPETMAGTFRVHEYAVYRDGTASVTFTNGESDGSTVTVDSVDFQFTAGFVAIYEGEPFEGLDTEQATNVYGEQSDDLFLGVSDSLHMGEHTDVEVPLETPLEAGEERTLAAIPYVSSERELEDSTPYQEPYGYIQIDLATISVEGEPVTPPMADFDVVTEDPSTGEEVEFDASDSEASSGAIVEYRWDLTGDEAVDATGETTIHTFAEPGDHTVTLTVVDDGGNEASTQQTVAVEDEPVTPPTANFNVVTEDPVVGEEVEFDASDSEAPDGTIEEYRWDLTGDGEVDATGVTILSAYDESDEYMVTLIVVDSNGNQDTTERVITVDDQSPGVDLGIVLLQQETVPVPGGIVRIMVTLANEGSMAISNPTINIDTPMEWQISERDDREGTWDEDEQRWDYNDLAAGETTESLLTMHVPMDVKGDDYTISAEAVNPAETLATVSETIAIEQRFEPTVHGFGFSNFEITDVHGSVDNFDRASIKATLESEWQSSITNLCDGFSETQQSMLLSVITDIGSYITSRYMGTISLWTLGHCYGMAAMAKQYYEDPAAIPVGDVETSAALTDPAQSDVHSEIDVAHRDQLLKFENFLSCLELFTGVGYDLTEEADRIKEQFDPANPLILGVNGIGNHAVLLYDVTEYGTAAGDTGTTFHLYDNNFTADETEVETRTFKVIEQGDQVTVDEPLMSRSTASGLASNSMDKIAFFSGPPTLDNCKELLDGIVTFEVFSPALLEMRDPNGDSLYPLDPDGTPIASEFRFDIAASDGDYGIDVVGTGSGEFTLEVTGVAWDGALIDEQVTGTIEEGEVQSFVATVPESATEEGTLEQVTRDSDDDLPEWVPYAGAGAGATGVGALLYRYLWSDEDSAASVSDTDRRQQESETTSDRE